MTALRWMGEPISEGGVTEHRFNLERQAGILPGILWTPTQHERPLPLVLLGHGGSGHKRTDGNSCWVGGLPACCRWQEPLPLMVPFTETV